MTSPLHRALASTAPVRWWRALRALVGGARVHPQAVLIGPAARLRLGPGCKLGPRVKLDTGSTGQIRIGKKAWIAADVEMQTDTAVLIGAGTTVQRRCTINGSTRLGAGCILAPGVFISSGTHPFRVIPHLPIREQERRLLAQPETAQSPDRPVWIQDDCWLGTHAVICPGVTIGKGSVIGANSVVTRDVPPYSVVAGSPARRIGTRLDWRPPSRIAPGRDEDAPYLLDGCVSRDAEGNAYVEISAHAPLLAAMNALPWLHGVVIDYWAPAPAVLAAGGLSVHVAAGRGRVELGRKHLRIADGVAYCELALPDGCASRVEVLGLECVESP